MRPNLKYIETWKSLEVEAPVRAICYSINIISMVNPNSVSTKWNLWTWLLLKVCGAVILLIWKINPYICPLICLIAYEYKKGMKTSFCNSWFTSTHIWYDIKNQEKIFWFVTKSSVKASGLCSNPPLKRSILLV